MPKNNYNGYKMRRLGLLKSHYSLGRSILSLEAPSGKFVYPVSIFDLLIQNKLNTLTLVEDNVSGLLQASQNATANKIKLIFGLRINITENCLLQDEDSLKKRAKYIVFAKNPAAYDDIIKIWSFAAKDGFYHNACLDFVHLRKLWTKNLMLCIPFYDSFIHLNVLHGHQHVPCLFDKPVFFLENNNLPFDDILIERTLEYCRINKYETLDTQSIFYKSKEDFLAYLAFRCIHNRGFAQKTTLDKPELNHMSSDSFNFDNWFSTQNEKEKNL